MNRLSILQVEYAFKNEDLKLMENRRLVNEFVEHLQKNRLLNLKVDCYPDDKNRNTPAIDAIAGPFAIEHTSIDTIPDQRLNSNRFTQFIGNLEQELVFLPFYLGITFKEDAITTRQDWETMRVTLKKWILEKAPYLPVSKPYTPYTVPGIPFEIYVTKNNDSSAGVRFSRFPPDDNTLPDRIRDLFNRKAAKLLKYQAAGKTTILLVENGDIALMNTWKLFNAIRNAYHEGLPSGVDEIWYADTSIHDRINFKDFTSDLLIR